MIPEVDGMLGSTAMRLMMNIIPSMPAGYSQSSANLSAILLILAAQQFENAAEIRVWENGEMRGLLARGKDWHAAAPIVPADSLKISALNAENHALKRALIALHERVEQAEGADARALERDILAFLKNAADRRRLHLPG